MHIKSFKELIVWQRSIELVEEIYKLTSRLPGSETYGLVSQMRRAAVSISSNIAEGKKRGTRKDFLQFLRIADGSAAELETQLIVVKRLYSSLDTLKIGMTLEEVQKMLITIIKRLRV